MTDVAIKLFGTQEIEPAPRIVRAGHLSASLDRGALRWVRWRGIEIIRGLFFLVRTQSWGTPDAEIADLSVAEDKDAFRIAYRGRVRDGASILAFSIALEGRAGCLSAKATIVPETDFLTNRTGFVVLHPLDGFVGHDLFVEHSDGREATIAIPAPISPAQPVRDIRALRLAPAEGISTEIRFAGEIFEMEDQRNWSDASFKTYSRPLDLPRPYALRAGETVEQSVSLTITEAAGIKPMVPAAPAAIRIRLGGPSGDRLPSIGLALDSHRAASAFDVAEILHGQGFGFLNVRHDLSRATPKKLADAARFAKALGLPVSLDLVIAAERDPRPEIDAVAAEMRAAGIEPIAIAGFPKIDERSFQPNEPRPPSPPLETIQSALRKTFPNAKIGGGTPAFFTELNRKRPPVAGLDVIVHTTCPIVHAADDLSVMESLETLPWIIRSARAFAPEKTYRIGPIGIGARLNPYGEGTEPNPSNRRVGLAEADPRQRGLFGAAWHVGYAAAIAAQAIDSLVVGAPTGPFGLVHTKQSYQQPWYDDRDGLPVFPLFHAIADLAAGGGKGRIDTETSSPRQVAALAWQDGGGDVLLLANLTAERLSVGVENRPGSAHARFLDETTFEAAASDWRGFRRRSQPLDVATFDLLPYAVATIWTEEEKARPIPDSEA